MEKVDRRRFFKNVLKVGVPALTLAASLTSEAVSVAVAYPMRQTPVTEAPKAPIEASCIPGRTEPGRRLVFSGASLDASRPVDVIVSNPLGETIKPLVNVPPFDLEAGYTNSVPSSSGDKKMILREKLTYNVNVVDSYTGETIHTKVVTFNCKQ